MILSLRTFHIHFAIVARCMQVNFEMPDTPHPKRRRLVPRTPSPQATTSQTQTHPRPITPPQTCIRPPLDNASHNSPPPTPTAVDLASSKDKSSSSSNGETSTLQSGEDTMINTSDGVGLTQTQRMELVQDFLEQTGVFEDTQINSAPHPRYHEQLEEIDRDVKSTGLENKLHR